MSLYLVSVYLIKKIRQRHLVGDEKTKKEKWILSEDRRRWGPPQVWTSALLHASLENSDRCERKEYKKKRKKRKEQTTAVASSSFSNWKQRRNTHSATHSGGIAVAKCIYIHQVVDDTTILYVYIFLLLLLFFYINIIRTAAERKMERRECYRLQQHHLKSQEIHFPFIYHNGAGSGEKKKRRES